MKGRAFSMKPKAKAFLYGLMLSIPVVFAFIGEFLCERQQSFQYSSNGGLQFQAMCLQHGVSEFFFTIVLFATVLIFVRIGAYRHKPHVDLRVFACVGLGSALLSLSWTVCGESIVARILFGMKPFVISSLQNGARPNESMVVMARDFLVCLNLLMRGAGVLLDVTLLIVLSCVGYKFFRESLQDGKSRA